MRAVTFCAVVIFVFVINKSDTLTNFDDAETITKVFHPQEAEWQSLISVLENDDLMSQIFGPSFYDIRSNETGLFNGTFSGAWNRFGYTTWLVKDQKANVSGYFIQEFDIVPDNYTLLIADYFHAQLSGSVDSVQWNKTINTRLMKRTETLVTLSESLGGGSGRLDIKSKASAHFSEEQILNETKRTDGKVVEWHIQTNGIVNSGEKLTHFVGFTNGKCTVQDSKEVMDKPLDKFNLLGQPSDWSENFSGLIAGEGNSRRFNFTSDRTHDLAILNNHAKESRNSTGYIWDNTHSLEMNLAGNFDKVLPSFLRFIF